MKKVFLFSLFLVLGLVLSQCLPVWLGEAFLTAEKVAKTLMFVCLAFIMINVGREFELDKTKWRSYAADYFIAMATAAVPWIMVAFYYMFLLPADLFGNWDAWKENLLLSRFAAPTSAGILFTMLAAAGLRREWIYKKTQVWDNRIVPSFFQPITNKKVITITTANNCHLKPIINICKGIISKLVSRSSKIASTWVFL